ncbi:hypothetical protein LOD99_12997 [Oopsacas minuta]|uniref:PX domain-containing protein n=1 Tax=Oopsacas minuta TaxID=111878 RepID=A0AAV7J9V9_9METZ|nr:hypothetical protein LOD99_12997 [Oopsacas minuta]
MSTDSPLLPDPDMNYNSSLQDFTGDGICMKDYAKIVYLNIPSAHSDGNHVVYNIEVGIPSCMWRVSKRYSEFFNLHQQLQWFYSFHSDELPKKKLIGNKTSALIEKRRSKLESYLKHVLRTFPIPPPQFLNFINYQYYDVVGVTQALASRLFHVGEKILASNDPAILSIVQMYCITRRLKLPLEKRSNDTSLDVANLYEFVNRLKHLKVVSDTQDCLSSSVLSELKFDLCIFRNLYSLQLEGTSMHQVEGWILLLDRLELLVIRNSARSVSDALLSESARKEERPDGVYVFPRAYKWKALTHLHLTRNYLKQIDETITLAPCLKMLNLSHNEIEELPELYLTSLHDLTVLDLSHNRLEQIESLHTKLGNIHTLDLSHNRIRSLVGLRKLYCVVILNLKFNSIDDLSYLSYLGKLPCIESLQLDNNPICYQIHYRIEVFGALPITYQTVVLDGFRPSQKELTAAEGLIKNRPTYGVQQDNSALPPSSVDARRVSTRRVVAVSEERVHEGEEGRVYEGTVSESESLRVATEQLRDKEGKNWLNHYNEQLEREIGRTPPLEPSATGQLPPTKAQGYSTSQQIAESDIRGIRPEADLTPAVARVSHVTDLDANSDAEDQVGRVFMASAVIFQGSLKDLRDLDPSALQELLSPPDEAQNESLVVKIDLESVQILFVSLENSKSESPKNFNSWNTICVLPSYPIAVCIEESTHSKTTCRLLCLSSNEEAADLCGLLHELVGEASPSDVSSQGDQSAPSSNPLTNSGEELTSTMQTLFATKIKGLYTKEGFFSTRIASELLGAVYYIQDLIPGSIQTISQINSVDTDPREEELVYAAKVGFLIPLSSRDEFYSLVLITTMAIHILEIDPTLSSLLLGETSHLLTVRLCEISKITIGSFDQSIKFESRGLGPLGVFTLFTRVYSVTQGIQNCLKEVLLTARLVPEVIGTPERSPTHNPLPSIQIEYQGTEHINTLKRILFLHSVKDTYNSMEAGEMEEFCDEGVKSIEILFYLIINEHTSDNIMLPISLILTKQMIYIGVEDYNETRDVKQITPFFQVLRSQPVSAIDNIELFRGEQTDSRLESEVNLYFEALEQSQTNKWRLFFTDITIKQQFITTLKKLWKDEFSRELKTSTVSIEMGSLLSFNYRSLKHKFQDRPHIVMPQELVDFAWQGARSLSAFLGIITRFSPSIKQRHEQIAFLMLTWCTPYSKPHHLIPTCAILTDQALYLCTTQDYYSLATDKTPNSEYTVCMYESINLVQIHEVVLGLFDYHFRLDTNYSTNTYAFLTFDNRQTSEFLSHLSDKFKKIQIPALGQEEIPSKEVSELDAKFSLTEVLLASPSEAEIHTLTEALQFEARKLIPASLLEGTPSIISYILVLFDIGESSMQPHAILLTGQALFLCRIDLVRWPIAKFVVSPPVTIQYEVVDALAFEWIERVELASFKSPAFELVFTAQRNTDANDETNSNSGSEECIDLSQPMACSCRWRLMTKDYKQRNMLMNALDGVCQGRDKNMPISIQLMTQKNN